MHEPPPLATGRLIELLRHHFGVEPRSLDFLPLGNDSASSVYRVEVDRGTPYLLKARARAAFRPASLALPRFLHEQGIPHVLAPLPAASGDSWVEYEGHALALYPFLEAPPAAGPGLSGAHWRRLGATVRAIHSLPPPPSLAALLPRERFVPSLRDRLDGLAPHLATDDPTDPIQGDFRRLWRAKATAIQALIDAADRLGAVVGGAGHPPVLCHGDLHLWNVLLDGDGALWIVDWDEAILAPKERDLMFFTGGGIGHGLTGEEETARFLEGYGATPIDPVALRYYRHAWAVQDIAAYTDDFLAPGASEARRRDALDGFADLFAPGNIVELALGGI